MSPALILACICGYFLFLLLIAWYTSRNAGNDAYFLGNRASPWYAVAFGLIGDSLSGVTFISVPGQVGKANFSYLQIVFGYVVGYLIIARVLLPLYYRLQLTSIYSYLLDRFGPNSQKTGSFFFLLSRTIGAAARLYLTAGVIQMFVFDKWGFPFWATVAIIIALILLYTYKGGIKTLVWTDTFQSSFLLLGVILSIVAVARQLNWGLGEMVSAISESSYSQIFVWEWQHKKFFWKEFFSGAAIAVVMTGLDQNMMQKNLSCRSLGEAQKNIYSFTAVLVFVNIFFVSLGALLYAYAHAKGVAIPQKTDHLFPMLALQHLGTFAAITFIVGLTAATFSSADSVLTTLTTSFCVDFLGMEGAGQGTSSQAEELRKTRTRHYVHIGFAVVLLIVILLCEYVPKTSVLDTIFTVAAFTYGPLLGLFVFGLFTKRSVNDPVVPVVSVVSVLVCIWLKYYATDLLGGYKFGYELLLLNGLLTFAGLLIISKKPVQPVNVSPL